jgi:hypothetical protein
MLGDTLRPNPIPRSRIREVHFENVGAAFVRKSVPWVPATPFPDHFEVDGLTTAALSRPNAAPTASFRWQATGDRGVFRLDASNSRDPDPDPALEIAGNGIVAYGWDLDGDDRIDAFGREALCRVEPAGMSKITLYVWDHQGQQAVSTQKIGEASAEYGELLVDPELQLSEPVPSAWMLDTGSADQGWCGSGEIRAQAGRLILEGSPHGQFSVGQIVLDRQERIGPQRLEWVAMHRGGGGRPNLATIEVWGVDGEFRADYWGGAPQPLGTIPHRATRLASIQVPPSGSRWLHESAVVDFADGFEFILIQVFGTGFEASAGDQLRLERVSIIGEGG